MRSFVRRELCVDSPINLKRLSPVMKIYAGVVTRMHNSNIHKRKLTARIEAKNLEQNRRDEAVKDSILAMIYRELDNNHSLAESGDQSAEVILSVNSRFADSLTRILGHKDFLPYSIEIVEENQDLRLAFPELPTLVRVRKKEI